jgi:hypothetical protein
VRVARGRHGQDGDQRSRKYVAVSLEEVWERALRGWSARSAKAGRCRGFRSMSGGMGGGQAPQVHAWAHEPVKVRPRPVVRMPILRTGTSVELMMQWYPCSVSWYPKSCKCAALKKKAAAADFDEKWRLQTRDRAEPSK